MPKLGNIERNMGRDAKDKDGWKISLTIMLVVALIAAIFTGFNRQNPNNCSFGMKLSSTRPPLHGLQLTEFSCKTNKK